MPRIFTNPPKSMLFAFIFLIVAIASVLLFDGKPIFIALYLGMSLLTYGVYYFDKKAAQQNARRIPEKSLLFLGLLCGWPGAIIAQQQFRHKTRKQPFKSLLWLSVALNIIGFVIAFSPEGMEFISSALKSVRY